MASLGYQFYQSYKYPYIEGPTLIVKTAFLHRGCVLKSLRIKVKWMNLPPPKLVRLAGCLEQIEDIVLTAEKIHERAQARLKGIIDIDNYALLS